MTFVSATWITNLTTFQIEILCILKELFKRSSSQSYHFPNLISFFFYHFFCFWLLMKDNGRKKKPPLIVSFHCDAIPRVAPPVLERSLTTRKKRTLEFSWNFQLFGTKKGHKFKNTCCSWENLSWAKRDTLDYLWKLADKQSQQRHWFRILGWSRLKFCEFSFYSPDVLRWIPPLAGQLATLRIVHGRM